MAAELITSIVTASGAVGVAGASYWFTKKREREAELRKEKLAHYKDFVACLSGVIEGEYTSEGQREFSFACNKLNLVAPNAVIRALQEFQQEIKVTNENKCKEEHDRLLSALFYEIRKDLEMRPADKKKSFKVGLWASGQPPRDL